MEADRPDHCGIAINAGRHKDLIGQMQSRQTSLLSDNDQTAGSTDSLGT